ncbi:uncharacterized protein LOC106142243 isoform X2 [Amyelois transitella]|uniref:uncharacterized protein LOC106142243 isoform X2 n=1 Tax=Amyelois transitella TaxID=680683 RepID=UPI00067D9913|nr:uncharacterized protein LOC106142243 isoform X2 [Amyelois transitella]
MDKSLEPYEFIPVDTEGETGQFFVVQEDGTYLINRQVQFVTEVQDVKTVLDEGQSCTVYDVSEQPFYVDVDNPPELMSVSDQFVLPNPPSNLYANSYLLQTSTSSDQVEDIPEVQYKPLNASIALDLEANFSKPVTNCTEITLTDEQCHKLEQKGWLLLDLNDKVFILDHTGGLRDITSNDKLIQKLRNDDTDVNLDIKPQYIKIENNSILPVTENLDSRPNDEFNIDSDSVQNDVNFGHLPLVVNDSNKDNLRQESAFENQELEATETNIASVNKATVPLSEDVKIFMVESERDENTEKVKNAIKIKTKLSLKDIPNRIVLGKTINGKTLVARVKTDVSSQQTIFKDNIVNVTCDPEEMLFTDFIKQVIQYPEQRMTQKDLNAIENIINHVAKASTVDHSIKCDDFLFITKVVKTNKNKGNIVKTKPIIWTGSAMESMDQWHFTHSPNILQNLLFSDDCSSSTVVHIQIVEEIQPGTNVVKTSVNVNKKQLLPSRSKKDPVFACSACASIFPSEDDLELHHQGCVQSMDTDDQSAEVAVKPLEICCIKSGKNEYYQCMQCNAKFTKISACKRHMNTHYRGSEKRSNNEKCEAGKKPNNGMHKCNICGSVFFHSSTLSKHIVCSHIQVVSD